MHKMLRARFRDTCQTDRNRRLLLESLEARHLLAALPVTAGLSLHLDADVGVATNGSGVTSWQDRSVRNNDVTAQGARPQLLSGALNGQDVIRFDGQNDGLGANQLTAFSTGQQDRTMFVVANYRARAWGGVSYGRAANNQAFGLMVAGNGRLGVQAWGSGNDKISTTAGRGSGWLTQSVVYRNGRTFHYRDGNLIDSDNHAFNTRDDRIRIGVELNDNRHIKMDVAEVIIYRRALSEGQRSQVESYLQNEYFGGGGGGNTAPVAVNDVYSVDRGGQLSTGAQGLPGVLNNDSDADGDTLSAVLVSGPSNGTLTLRANGSIVYNHNGSSANQDSFRYRANDGEANSGIATVTINVNSAPNGSNMLITRWHGDYYQHLWDSSFPGGSNPAVRENRWLRGGPPAGAQKSTINLDLDNDGQIDDSRVYFEYSLSTPLNPRNFSNKPNGIHYHSNLPSGRFYGGISVDFLNYETRRIQQAFIENDGAGGDVADVGYPSPYLGPQHAGLRNFIESVRHSDGRYKKSHVGPHEDFAINIYRPDLPHPINSNDNPGDNRNKFYAAFIWKKADFLGAARTGTVSLDGNSKFSFESTRWWENVGKARWILQRGNGHLYVSEFSVNGGRDNWGRTNSFNNPLNSRWARYTPQSNNLRFNANTANWQSAGNLFNDIRAVGVYVENDSASSGLTKFSLDEIQFTAVVSQNGSSQIKLFDRLLATKNIAPDANLASTDSAMADNGDVVIAKPLRGALLSSPTSSVDDYWSTDDEEMGVNGEAAGLAEGEIDDLFESAFI